MINLLVINPNSSQSVTKNLESILVAPPEVKLHFYTAPPEAPKEISGTETSISSAVICLPDLLQLQSSNNYDGFLVGCYSNHPLIESLAKNTKKPTLGIMQATLLYSILNPSISKLFILTSYTEWEPLLDALVCDIVGNSPGQFPSQKFQKSKGLNVSVLSLADPTEFAKIENRVTDILNGEYKNDNIDCILLGCAGMAGLDTKLAASFPHIQFIDCLKVGVELLTSLVRFNHQLSS